MKHRSLLETRTKQNSKGGTKSRSPESFYEQRRQSRLRIHYNVYFKLNFTILKFPLVALYLSSFKRFKLKVVNFKMLHKSIRVDVFVSSKRNRIMTHKLTKSKETKTLC